MNQQFSEENVVATRQPFGLHVKARLIDAPLVPRLLKRLRWHTWDFTQYGGGVITLSKNPPIIEHNGQTVEIAGDRHIRLVSPDTVVSMLIEIVGGKFSTLRLEAVEEGGDVPSQ